MSNVSSRASLHPAFTHSTYMLRRQFFKLLGAAFHIYDMNGNVVFYSKQKAFKLKEELTVYTGEDMQTPLLTMKARNIIDISATYDVTDATNNEKVGALRRKGLKSILIDEWVILDNQDREIGFIKEDSALMATIRRFLTNLIPQTFHGEIGGKQVCSFSQHFNPFIAKITIDFAADNTGLLDRRLGIAAAVLLCAIEGRQQ